MCKLEQSLGKTTRHVSRGSGLLVVPCVWCLLSSCWLDASRFGVRPIRPLGSREQTPPTYMAPKSSQTQLGLVVGTRTTTEPSSQPAADQPGDLVKDTHPLVYLTPRVCLVPLVAGHRRAPNSATLKCCTDEATAQSWADRVVGCCGLGLFGSVVS
jgi:hypothetical protein